MKKDYKQIASLVWQAYRIPVYVYENATMLFCFPEQDSYLYPTDKDVNFLKDSPYLSCSTSLHTIFVKIPCLKKENIMFMIGPVSSLKYNQSMLAALHREYVVAYENRELFNDFFYNIPTLTLGDFFRYMQIVYYMINDTAISLDAFLPESFPSDRSVKFQNRSQQVEATFLQSDNEYSNNSYEVEAYMLQLVKSGNIKGMQDFISSIPVYHAGSVARDILRMQKNYMITTISLSVRAAIEAGLPTEQAFQLSDLYITKLEELTNINDINQLSTDFLLDVTGQVEDHISSSIIPAEITGIPPLVTDCMNYIKSHTNQKITVSSVANVLGYDRTYLSNLFSKSLGFTMGKYITRCKLEESKMLLIYTRKDISEIANYLCFSSQSHFQLRFRETFHTTPAEYRKSNQH